MRITREELLRSNNEVVQGYLSSQVNDHQITTNHSNLNGDIFRESLRPECEITDEIRAAYHQRLLSFSAELFGVLIPASDDVFIQFRAAKMNGRLYNTEDSHIHIESTEESFSINIFNTSTNTQTDHPLPGKMVITYKLDVEQNAFLLEHITVDNPALYNPLFRTEPYPYLRTPEDLLAEIAWDDMLLETIGGANSILRACDTYLGTYDILFRSAFHQEGIQAVQKLRDDVAVLQNLATGVLNAFDTFWERATAGHFPNIKTHFEPIAAALQREREELLQQDREEPGL